MIKKYAKLLSKKFRNLKPIKPWTKYTYCWDPGHGGLIDGVYQTDGKRSPIFPDGRILYEGVFNRNVVNFLKVKCKKKGIRFFDVVDSQHDIPMYARTNKANAKNIQTPCIYVSVHANADKYGDKFTSAHGTETYYFKKGTRYSVRGKEMATKLQQFLIEEIGLTDRGAKGANFAVLRESDCPAVLIEAAFMTNFKEASLLMTQEFQESVANAIIRFIEWCEQTY